MSSFSLKLLDATRSEEISGVTTFVGEDQTGGFAIRAGHVRMMTRLDVGLSRFRIDNDVWRYLALPGGILYFRDNVLTLSSSHYLIGGDYMNLSRALHMQLAEEQKQLARVKESLGHMEKEILKYLWRKGTLRTG